MILHETRQHKEHTRRVEEETPVEIRHGYAVEEVNSRGDESTVCPGMHEKQAEEELVVVASNRTVHERTTKENAQRWKKLVAMENTHQVITRTPHTTTTARIYSCNC